MGTTGNIYYVTLNRVPKCSCLDQRFPLFLLRLRVDPHRSSGRTRKRNCKHILFVYIRVLKLDESDAVVVRSVSLCSRCSPLLSPPFRRSQASLSEVELKRVRALASAHVAEQVVAAPAVLSAYEASTGQRAHINLSAVPTQPKVNQREIEEGDECPICYEPLVANQDGKSEDLKFCTQKCGRAVHLEVLFMSCW